MTACPEPAWDGRVMPHRPAALAAEKVRPRPMAWRRPAKRSVQMKTRRWALGDRTAYSVPRAVRTCAVQRCILGTSRSARFSCLLPGPRNACVYSRYCDEDRCYKGKSKVCCVAHDVP